MNSVRKGKRFELEVVGVLKSLIPRGVFRKNPGSGAIGTAANIPFLQGDIWASVEGLPRPIYVETKFGYGGREQFSIKKMWLDKAIAQASSSRAIPIIISRFQGTRRGYFCIIPLDELAWILNFLAEVVNADLGDYSKESGGSSGG